MVLYVLAALGGLAAAFLLFLTVCSLAVNPKKTYTQDSRFYRFLINASAFVTFRLLRIQIHTSGIEKIPKGRMVLFVGNHRSNYDPIISWYVLRAWRPAFLSKASNFKIPIFGRLIRKCCFMAIDRSSPRNALSTIYRAADLLAKQAVSIAVYPEGTRSKTGKLLPFHNGVFKIAQRAGAPVAVLAISGTEKIAGNLLRLKPSQISLDVLAVIPQETVCSVRTDAIGTQVRTLLEASGASLTET